MLSRRAVLVATGAAAVLVGCLAGPVLGRDPGRGSPLPAPVLSDAAYASASAAQVLDLWVPASGRRPYPLVIFIHGGGWSGGDKRDVGPKLAPLLQHGFAVASIDYRLSDEARFPAPGRDVKAAVRHLRAHASEYGIDPGRFAVWGESAGANLAALAGTTGNLPTVFDDPTLGDTTTSAAVQAVVDWYGPIDLALREAQYRAGGSDCREPQLADMDRYTSGYLGADVERVPEQAAAANPMTYLRPSGGVPPFSIAQGTADCLVPVVQAEQLAEALHRAGDRAELHLLRGAVHADPRFDAELLAPTIDWLSTVLGPPG